MLVAGSCSRGRVVTPAEAAAVGGPGVRRQPLPAAQNAFPLWTNAMAILKEGMSTPDIRHAISHVGSFSTNVVWDEVRGPLSEWREDNSDAFAAMDRAEAVGRIQFPAPESDDPINAAGGLGGWVELGSAKIVSGRLFAARGAFSDAAREYLGVCALGQRLMAGEGLLVTYLIGAGVQAQGLRAVRALGAEKAAPDALLHDLLKGLPAPATRDTNLWQACGTEEIYMQRALREIDGRGSKRGAAAGLGQRIRTALVFDARETVAQTGRVFGLARSNAWCAASWDACDRALFAELESRAKARGLDVCDVSVVDWGALFTVWKCAPFGGNVLGEHVVSSCAGAVDGALRSSFRARTQVGLTRAFIALCLLRREAGAYPDALDEAVSRRLLPEVPVDFFDGRRIRYSPAKRLLWSVSDNGVDDGGAARKDLVIALPE
jgi:hypothetical protein